MDLCFANYFIIAVYFFVAIYPRFIINEKAKSGKDLPNPSRFPWIANRLDILNNRGEQEAISILTTTKYRMGKLNFLVSSTSAISNNYIKV